MSTHKLHLAYEYEQCKAMQDMRERDRGENRSNVNTMICFEVRATAPCPRLHTERFPLCPHRTFLKGISTEELQLNTESTQLLSSTNIFIQEGRQKT